VRSSSLVTVRLRGDYLAIVTLGFAETIRIVASNAIRLTNGTDGISGIPGPWRGALSPEAFNCCISGSSESSWRSRTSAWSACALHPSDACCVRSATTSR
jgi:ABC-type branched-subunit amino acid transport system permease subunit